VCMPLVYWSTQTTATINLLILSIYLMLVLLMLLLQLSNVPTAPTSIQHHTVVLIITNLIQLLYHCGKQ
jgi:hypothetical protein